MPRSSPRSRLVLIFICCPDRDWQRRTPKPICPPPFPSLHTQRLGTHAPKCEKSGKGPSAHPPPSPAVHPSFSPHCTPLSKHPTSTLHSALRPPISPYPSQPLPPGLPHPCSPLPYSECPGKGPSLCLHPLPQAPLVLGSSQGGSFPGVPPHISTAPPFRGMWISPAAC